MKLFEEFVNEARYSLKKAKMPDVNILYHTSNPAFRDKIAEEGLTPQVGDSYSLHYDSKKDLKPGVFLSVEKYDSTYDDDVYEVDTSFLNPDKFYKDPDEDIDDEWYLYIESIPLDAIKLVYKGTGK